MPLIRDSNTDLELNEKTSMKDCFINYKNTDSIRFNF